MFYVHRTKYVENHQNVLSIALHPLPAIAELDGVVESLPLYPYHSVKLVVFFVYGSDYQRQLNNNVVNKLKLFIFNWTNLLVVLAAMALCFVRRWQRLRHDGFISVLIDVTVIFIGGGRLRPAHRFERWFFVLLSIGAFFLNAIGLDSTLFPSYLHPLQSIETFQQLSEINPPTYIPPILGAEKHLIRNMLRYIF